MKHRFLTKIVAAGLVVMGEGAFPSESNECCDDIYESTSHVIQLSLLTSLDGTASGSQPSLASGNAIKPDTSHTTQLFTAVTVPVSELLKYHPFNPRAPPIPAG